MKAIKKFQIKEMFDDKNDVRHLLLRVETNIKYIEYCIFYVSIC